MAAVKATRTKGAWGGPRRGSGRKPKPRAEVRRNRVVVTLTDADLAALHRWAEERGLPLGTVVYEVVERALRRQEHSRSR